MKKLLTGTAIALTAAALASGASAASHSISACLITKTDTNPFFVKMKEGASAKAEELGIDLDEHIAFIVESMKPVAQQIDLVAEPTE